MKNNREKGDKLEDQVAYDLGIKKTNNSGAKFDNGDLTDRNHIIECKYKTSPNGSFIGSAAEINKLKKQAGKHDKEWIYIQQNNTSTYVLMDYNFFMTLWQDYSAKNT